MAEVHDGVFQEDSIDFDFVGEEAEHHEDEKDQEEAKDRNDDL